MRNHILLVFICFLLPLLCSAQESMITISASARASGMSGHGIVLFIENIETHEIYKSKSLNGMSNNAVIENVSAGLYEVCRVEIPFGDKWFMNDSPELKSFFGTLEIRPNTNYFMGKYLSTFQGKISNRQVLFSLEGHVMPEKLIKFINKKGLDADGFVPIKPKEESFVLAELSNAGLRISIGL